MLNYGKDTVEEVLEG